MSGGWNASEAGANANGCAVRRCVKLLVVDGRSAKHLGI